jgi:Tol biopolymer transport system component
MKIAKMIFIVVAGLLISCSEDTIETFGTGTITGVVVEDGTNEPIENVRISSNPSASTVFTDENGEFVLNDVEEGEYSIQARMDGYITAFEGATVRPGNEVNVVFELQESTADNRAPSAPLLLSPEDGATDMNLSVDFAWSGADPEGDDLNYTLELRNNRNNEIQSFEGITDTTYTVTDLQYGYKYFWQVKVSDSINDTVLSEVRSFTTTSAPENNYYFAREVNGNNVIFASDGAGNETMLTDPSKNSFRPRKNNNVNKIAYLQTVGDRTQLFVMNPDGSEKMQITNEIPVRGIDYSRIGFSWADDGKSLLYPNFDKLYRTDVNGAGKQVIYQSAEGRYIMDIQESSDETFIAVLETDLEGYEGSIFLIRPDGTPFETIVENMDGVVDGIDISANGNYILFTNDVSGYEVPGTRQLNSKMFIYDRNTGNSINMSEYKPNGTNDTDARFSPNEASIIFVNRSNAGDSNFDIYTINYSEDFNLEEEDRILLIENGKMPDWQ